jgi:hypothetical protein
MEHRDVPQWVHNDGEQDGGGKHIHALSLDGVRSVHRPFGVARFIDETTSLLDVRNQSLIDLKVDQDAWLY